MSIEEQKEFWRNHFVDSIYEQVGKNQFVAKETIIVEGRIQDNELYTCPICGGDVKKNPGKKGDTAKFCSNKHKQEYHIRRNKILGKYDISSNKLLGGELEGKADVLMWPIFKNKNKKNERRQMRYNKIVKPEEKMIRHKYKAKKAKTTKLKPEENHSSFVYQRYY